MEMAVNGRNITGKQAKTIMALIACKTKGQAAKRAGIGEQTLYRWLADPVFVAAYKAAVDKFLADNICQLQSRTDQALQTFVDIMDDEDAGYGARLNAARAIYDYSLKCRELADTAKLDELERLIKANGAGVEIISYEQE